VEPVNNENAPDEEGRGEEEIKHGKR
jgi:hypothetical protein